MKGCAMEGALTPRPPAPGRLGRGESVGEGLACQEDMAPLFPAFCRPGTWGALLSHTRRIASCDLMLAVSSRRLLRRGGRWHARLCLFLAGSGAIGPSPPPVFVVRTHAGVGCGIAPGCSLPGPRASC